MALSKKIKVEGAQYIEMNSQRFPNGTNSIDADAYIRVSAVFAKKPTSVIDVEIKIGDIAFIENYRFEADLANGAENHIKQAYVYLKTLPRFAGSVDC